MELELGANEVLTANGDWYHCGLNLTASSFGLASNFFPRDWLNKMPLFLIPIVRWYSDYESALDSVRTVINPDSEDLSVPSRNFYETVQSEHLCIPIVTQVPQAWACSILSSMRNDLLLHKFSKEGGDEYEDVMNEVSRRGGLYETSVTDYDDTVYDVDRSLLYIIELLRVVHKPGFIRLTEKAGIPVCACPLSPKEIPRLSWALEYNRMKMQQDHRIKTALWNRELEWVDSTIKKLVRDHRTAKLNKLGSLMQEVHAQIATLGKIDESKSELFHSPRWWWVRWSFGGGGSGGPSRGGGSGGSSSGGGSGGDSGNDSDSGEPTGMDYSPAPPSTKSTIAPPSKRMDAKTSARLSNIISSLKLQRISPDSTIIKPPTSKLEEAKQLSIANLKIESLRLIVWLEVSDQKRTW